MVEWCSAPSLRYREIKGDVGEIYGDIGQI